MAARIEVDGRNATAEDLRALDLSPVGHFTAMQVRDGATLGLDFHLARLDAATRELFGVGLDADRVRGRVRHALTGVPDATVRVNLHRPPDRDDVAVVVSVRPPGSPPRDGHALQSFVYGRPTPHLKRSFGFGQGYFAGLAQANGFDEALFVGPDGEIAEGSITNVGFVTGDGVVWPDAPALLGVMMQVLQRALDHAGIPWRSETIRLDDIDRFDGAFVTNSRGFATVARIDDRTLTTDAELLATAADLLRRAPLDPI